MQISAICIRFLFMIIVAAAIVLAVATAAVVYKTVREAKLAPVKVRSRYRR